ncbi:hypothetical protein ACQ86N_47010 [Puia sp. P3]|uniref:hypothetical protein n=1 Tax=Puia sp. P3 TaxID=3423952 RepID=UPI003D66F208
MRTTNSPKKKGDSSRPTCLLTPPSAADLALYLELRQTLQQRLPKDAGSEALRSTTSEFNKQYFTVADRRPALVRRIAFSAAAAACVIVVIGLFLLPGKDRGLDQLGRTEMVNITSRGGIPIPCSSRPPSSSTTSNSTRPFPCSTRPSPPTPAASSALFYRGVTEWHMGAADQARKDLIKVYNGESLLRYEAAFYMALSFAGEKRMPPQRNGWTGFPKAPPSHPVLTS